MARRILPVLLSTVVVVALAPAAALAEGQVTLDPAAGAPGTSVVLRGSGFGAARPVTVGVSGAATRSVTSSRTGAFLAHLTIPGRLRGSIAVVSRRGRMRVVNRFFAAPGAGASSVVEVASSLGRRVRATPARLVAGGTLRLSGSGFGRGRRLTLSVFGVRHRLTTRRDGTFVMTVRAPGTLPSGVMSAVLTGAGDTLRLHLVTSAPTGPAPPATTATGPAPATTPAAPAPAQPSAPAAKPGPANTTLPQITGRAQEGQTLKATTGTWSGKQPITFAYRWERCNPVCFALAGATPTHKLDNADVGFTVHVLVTATNADGSATATSNDSAVVTPLVSPTGQVALWHMNEASGTVMADSARNHNGTLTRVAPGQPSFLGGGTAFGFAGKSFASVPSAGDLNPGDFAIRVTIHVKATLLPQPPTEDWDLIRKGVFTTAGGEFKMEYQPNGQASCGFNGSLGYNEIVGRGPVINDDQWHTVQCAKTSTGIELNVDGVAFTKPGAVGAIANNEPVVIGSHGGTAEFFQGTLDEADIFIG